MIITVIFIFCLHLFHSYNSLLHKGGLGLTVKNKH